MSRIMIGALMILVAALTPAGAADGTYAIKTAATPIPKEIKESIAKLLSDQAVQFYDGKENLLCELWFRKQLPSKATADQIKNGLTYQELEETTLLGAARVVQLITDYRKHKIKPGVYTIRLGFQPMDGDHMGTAPYPEFGLFVPIGLDTGPDPMTPKALQEISAKATGGSHPGVFLLFPNSSPPDTPRLANMEGKWVVQWKEDVISNGLKGILGFGLTLIGHADS